MHLRKWIVMQRNKRTYGNYSWETGVDIREVGEVKIMTGL